MLRRLNSFSLAGRLWQSFLAELITPTRRPCRKQHSYRPRLESLEARETPAVYLVTTTINGVPNANDGSLRDAILASNANPGPDTIEFDIEPGGTQTISLTSPLPTLADTVTIDGTSQPAWVNHALVVIDGSQLGQYVQCGGLTTTAAGCKIEGLTLQGFSQNLGAGIRLCSNNNTVVDDSFNSDDYGVEITNDSSGNVIGGTTTRDGNQIGQSVRAGIVIDDYSNNNTVEGNSLTIDDPALFEPVGIFILNGANHNTIGGTSSAATNQLYSPSGASYAIDLYGGSDNFVQGNYAFGFVTGILDDGQNDTIGGTALGSANTIFSCSGDGLLIGAYAYGVTIVEGNSFTRNAAGIEVDNGYSVSYGDASSITIGGTDAGAGNIISGNTGPGILIDSGVGGTTIEGNKIGTDSSGKYAYGNNIGIEVDAANTTIGGTVAGAGNLISGNTNQGILVDSRGVIVNSVGPNQINQGGAGPSAIIEGNKIGTDITGSLPLGNGTNGVEVRTSGNTIGGIAAGDANVIAFNGTDGVFVAAGTTGNAIRQNSIFANVALGIQLGINVLGGPAGPGNNGQAAPTLSTTSPPSFNAKTNKLTITGTLPNPATAGTFILDFYANMTGETQGRIYLGSYNVPAKGGTGTTTFTATLAITAAAFSTATTPNITATATDPLGNTSQFSATVEDPEIAAPTFTSAKTVTFTVNTAGSFTVTVSGFPTPTLTMTGALPKGLKFDRTTGIISGTPKAGTRGTYKLHFTARNGIGAVAKQTLTLTVNKLATQLDIADENIAWISVAAPVGYTALSNN